LGTNSKREYIVLTKSQYNNLTVNFSLVEESNTSTVRWDNAKENCFLSYIGNKPNFLSGITDVYNHSGILEKMLTADWVSDEDNEF
tara:strand:- start:649 stop:906 length:258 start_codon:yes stop_codon:yes gene_type:complete